MKSIALSLILIVWGMGAAAQSVSCEHFWLKGTARVASGKTVGVDVGQSPYGSDGVYECRVFITSQDVTTGRLLFIGEVGDASYVLPISGPSGPLGSLPIYHGLTPDPRDQAHYLRFIPFVVSLRDLYQADGWHKFELHYRDLIPLQTGIRSGPPTIENTKGAIRRAVFNAPAFSYHLIQIVVFLVIAFGALIWRGLRVANRLRLFVSALSAAAVVCSITGFPRFFISSPEIAVRLNDIVNLMGTSLVFLPFVGIVELPNLRFSRVAGVVVAFAAAWSAMYCFFPAGGEAALRFYAIGLLLVATAYPLVLSWLWGRGILRPQIPLFKAESAWLMLFAGLVFWDAGVNILFLNIQFQFFLTHFFLFLPAQVWQIRLYMKEIEVERDFPVQLEKIKDRGLRNIAQDPTRAEALSALCRDYASLTGAERVSMVEILDNDIKFLGKHGAFEKTEGLQAIQPDSYIQTVQSTQAGHSGVTRFRTDLAKSPTLSQFFVLPLHHQDRIRGVLCLTDFRTGYLPGFVRRRLQSLQGEAEILFSLLLLERDNKAQSTLLQLARLRVHPVQLKSEKHFLDHFSVSDGAQSPVFIVGDLVDSTPLNKVYGANKTRIVIGKYLENLFERFKHLGVVISNRNGDEIAIVLPNQQSDQGDQVAQRAQEIIAYLGAEQDLKQMARENGIGLPFQFKYAASQAVNTEPEKSAASALGFLSVVSDAEIDSAYRVMSSVALPGECLILPQLARKISDRADLVEMSRDRLKGISTTMSLYSLSRKLQAKNIA